MAKRRTQTSQAAYDSLEEATERGGGRSPDFVEIMALEIGYDQAIKDVRKQLKSFNKISGDQEETTPALV
jgi:hypothetical protein